MEDSVMMVPLQIQAIWDAEAEVYVATSDDVPGLVAEAGSLDKLQDKVMGLIQELLELNGSPAISRAIKQQTPELEVPFQMVTTSRVTLHA